MRQSNRSKVATILHIHRVWVMFSRLNHQIMRQVASCHSARLSGSTWFDFHIQRLQQHRTSPTTSNVVFDPPFVNAAFLRFSLQVPFQFIGTFIIGSCDILVRVSSRDILGHHLRFLGYRGIVILFPFMLIFGFLSLCHSSSSGFSRVVSVPTHPTPGIPVGANHVSFSAGFSGFQRSFQHPFANDITL